MSKCKKKKNIEGIELFHLLKKANSRFNDFLQLCFIFDSHILRLAAHAQTGRTDQGVSAGLRVSSGPGISTYKVKSRDKIPF